MHKASVGCALMVAGFLLPLPTSAAGPPPLTAYETAQLDALSSAWLRRKRELVPALSIAVGLNGQLIFTKGYGEARPGVPASERTVYRIGSLSKQFTAAAILTLIDKGTGASGTQLPVNLDTPVSSILGRFAGWEGAPESAPTLRRLLTMTSGLAEVIAYPPAGVDPWGRVSAERILRALQTAPRAFGAAGFSYSNSNYFLLAQAIEALSAARQTALSTFESYVRRTLIDHLRLSDTGFIGHDGEGDSTWLAAPYWGKTPRHHRHPAFVEADWLKGAADMVSSATDLFAWDKAIMEGRALSPASRLLMFSDAARVTRSRYYAMAWFVDHEREWDWFTHGGFTPGYTALNMIVRNTRDGTWMSVSLLTNADGVEGLETLAKDIASAVRRHLPSKAISVPTVQEPVECN